jgi:hypothetical protein
MGDISKRVEVKRGFLKFPQGFNMTYTKLFFKKA